MPGLLIVSHGHEVQPLLEPQIHGDNLQHLVVRNEECSGWECFTTAQQFGIIIGAIMGLMALTVIWFCFLGRVISARQRRRSISLPGGRRARTNRHMPANVALANMPIAYQQPGHGVILTHQPMIYDLNDPRNRRAQPYLQPVPHVAQPQPVFWQNGHQHYPVWSYASKGPTSAARGGEAHRSDTTEDDLLTDDWRPRRRTWSQLLAQLMRLPTGRASTISSSSRRASLESHPSVSPRGHEESRKDGPAVGQHAPKPQRNREARHAQTVYEEDEEIQSLRTDAATIHSDDFVLHHGESASRAGPSSRRASGCRRHKTVDNDTGHGMDGHRRLYPTPPVLSAQSPGRASIRVVKEG